MTSERSMFERSFQRPKNYFKLSAGEQWAIDSNLGILDWAGDGLTDEDMERFRNHYESELVPMDALGNPIRIGSRYGYSQQSNGSVMVVIGTVEKVNGLKATVANAESRSGLYGEIKVPFTKETRKRAVNACHLFPIQ
jgi:hypothetical protein